MSICRWRQCREGGGNKIPSKQQGKIYFILTGNSQIHRQREFSAEQPGLAAERNRPFTITQKNVPRRRKAAVFLEEVIYPCDYMDSFQAFSETKLPAEKAFYSEANGKRIMEEGHEDAQNV